MKRAAGAYGEIRDRFSEWMTKAMSETDSRVADRLKEHFDKAAEARREADERLAGVDEKRRGKASEPRDGDGSGERPGMIPPSGRNADVAAQVSAYASKAAAPLVTLQKKVA